jgi:hypothetical protein
MPGKRVMRTVTYRSAKALDLSCGHAVERKAVTPSVLTRERALDEKRPSQVMCPTCSDEATEDAARQTSIPVPDQPEPCSARHPESRVKCALPKHECRANNPLTWHRNKATVWYDPPLTPATSTG